ncbi:MBL fold metallo-hydrolase, partial [Candidatus Gottesmanbacteria bacterium]|nr:MBL fold metallo-hydrolase [Candidatus Gottesmanbacteria bacterium]
MRVEKLVVGQLWTNCYLVWDEKDKKGIIIDPGDDADFIVQKIQDFKVIPSAIIATHGHFDHVLAGLELKLAFNIPFVIH